jgi:hypothetical protein
MSNLLWYDGSLDIIKNIHHINEIRSKSLAQIHSTMSLATLLSWHSPSAPASDQRYRTFCEVVVPEIFLHHCNHSTVHGLENSGAIGRQDYNLVLTMWNNKISAMRPTVVHDKLHIIQSLGTDLSQEHLPPL